MSTNIEWCQRNNRKGDTWNFMTGCQPISPGCKNCYAKGMANRLKKNPLTKLKYANGFDPTIHWEELENPKFPTRQTTIFPCSMSDLYGAIEFFGPETGREIIRKFLQTVRANPQHMWVTLTKRAWVLEEFDLNIPGLWTGVTICNQDETINAVRLATLETHRVISFEPLLSEVSMPDVVWQKMDWIIVGGETGTKSCCRPMNIEWVSKIHEKCQEHRIPFFFKKWGNAMNYAPANPRLLHFYNSLERVREMPF